MIARAVVQLACQHGLFSSPYMNREAAFTMDRQTNLVIIGLEDVAWRVLTVLYLIREWGSTATH